MSKKTDQEEPCSLRRAALRLANDWERCAAMWGGGNTKEPVFQMAATIYKACAKELRSNARSSQIAEAQRACGEKDV